MDFHSLGSYLGAAVGATSHSFGGNVGLYYKALHTAPWATDPAAEWPDERACHARRFLRKSLFQLWHRRPDVWYVNPEGSNLDSVISDVKKAVLGQALPWLDEHRDLGRALVAFESREDREMRSGIGLEAYGGGLNSFARAEAASALALACGQPKRARDAWQRMLANPYYRPIPELQREGERRLALIRGVATTPSKGMKVTKLRAAAERRAEVPPCGRAAGPDAGSALQLIPGARRTLPSAGRAAPVETGGAVAANAGSQVLR